MSGRGQLWEVIGGDEDGGIIVRGAKALTSPHLPERLIIGSLVQQLRLEGSRLYYWKVAGHGPDYGWVSVTSHGEDLLTRTDKMPWDYVLTDRALKAIQDSKAPLKKKTLEVKGVFTNYHQVHFADSKPTGLRLSACLVAMDELRTEMYQETDMTVASFDNVVDHILEVAIELHPGITSLSNQDDGLLYTTKHAKGPILSWLRVESQLGWPTSFPHKIEEHTAFLVGKDKFGPARNRPIATARFLQTFCESSDKSVPLEADQWRQDFEKFWEKPRGKYSSGKLSHSRLAEIYPTSGNTFSPVAFAKVSLRLTHCFQDLWGSLNHAKVPEFLWDINTLAGSRFADLLQNDDDPQAFAANMPKNMCVGRVYDVYCFLEASSRKTVYVVVPEGEKQVSECVLAICARYEWQGVPASGKTLTSEDLSMLYSDGQRSLLEYAINGSKNNFCDFSALP